MKRIKYTAMTKQTKMPEHIDGCCGGGGGILEEHHDHDGNLQP